MSDGSSVMTPGVIGPIDQLDSEGDILQEWVQELKLARIRQPRVAVPCRRSRRHGRRPGGVQELLRQWDSKK